MANTRKAAKEMSGVDAAFSEGGYETTNSQTHDRLPVEPLQAFFRKAAEDAAVDYHLVIDNVKGRKARARLVIKTAEGRLFMVSSMEIVLPRKGYETTIILPKPALKIT